jgi:CBS-domain-containing membrane protein
MNALNAMDLLRELENNRFGFFKQLKTVADIMTAKVLTLSVDHKVKDALELFSKNSIQHVPVIDPETNELLGIVSDRDLLRHAPRFLGTLVEGDNDQRALNTNLSQLMTRKPIHTSRSATLLDGVSLMLDNHIDCLLVYDDPKELHGIVTPSNFLKTILLYYRFCVPSDVQLTRLRLIDLERHMSIEEIFRYGAQTVRDVMAREVATLSPDQLVADAIALIQERRTRHVPIVDANKTVLGLVTDRDVLRALGPAANKQGPPAADKKFREALFAVEKTDPVLKEKLSTIMNRKLFAQRPEAMFQEAIRTFVDQDVSCLPVSDAQSRLVGIVTKTDVLRLFRVVLRLATFTDAPQQAA